ncbi:cation acetate symporter [Saccharopolyspora shandongensis]|uniref:sodium/solute symporter n=1 Tax=Saccharopolyspora shandongensis TaxID=418495 RepID=UPI0033F9285D
MNTGYSLLAVLIVVIATALVGTYGFRISRTTSDFYVASRSVSPWWNASAIGGEYLSAASFLGVAGLIFAFGPDMLWYAVGYTVGYLFLLTLVAAPLRRSGAYTLPDFAESRLESVTVRRIASVFTVGIGWMYLLPQLSGAGLTLQTVTGAPPWLGGLIVVVVVTVNVAAGGMRSITFVQAFQYWLKFGALVIPAVFMVLAWLNHGAPGTADPPRPDESSWAATFGGGEQHPLYVIYALMIATFLGAMGLPHVVVRFYTSPTGRDARRTTIMVLGLLSMFYLLVPVYGALGRLYVPELLLTGQTDTVVLLLPGRIIGGLGGQLLAALLAGGAFAAFLSTSSGLMVSVAGVLSQDVLPGSGSVRAFRFATLLAAVVPFVVALTGNELPAATVVGLAFAVAASAFSPLLLLGIWWRRLTSVGAAAGMVLGGGSALLSGVLTISRPDRDGWIGTLLTWPAAWTVPLGFLTMIVVSLLTPGFIAPGVHRTMAKLHLPGARRTAHDIPEEPRC